MKSPIDPQTLPLRDIHLPPPPSWWPPAPGWWLVAIAAIVVPILAVLWWRARRRGALRRAALRELATLRTRTDDPVRLAAETALLLRRISLALDPAHHHVAVTGDAWLARLRAIAPGFEDAGLAASLLTAPYAHRPNVDTGPLLDALERWSRALPASTRRRRDLAAAPADV